MNDRNGDRKKYNLSCRSILIFSLSLRWLTYSEDVEIIPDVPQIRPNMRSHLFLCSYFTRSSTMWNNIWLWVVFYDKKSCFQWHMEDHQQHRNYLHHHTTTPTRTRSQGVVLWWVVINLVPLESYGRESDSMGTTTTPDLFLNLYVQFLMTTS